MDETGTLFNLPPLQLPLGAPSIAAPTHPDRMSDAEIIGAVIGGGASAKAVARRLLQRFGTLAATMAASFHDLQLVAGVTPAMAQSLMLTHQVTLRITRQEACKRVTLSSWSALTAYLKVAMANEPREQFRVIFLDKKNGVIADEVMNHGTVDHAPVYVREVVKRALELSASALVLSHNHPSGDPTPSGADIDMTRQLIAGAKTVGIQIHDHMVIGRDGVSSFKALGLI